jgi:nitrate/nitrite transport system permease protein
VQLLKPVSPLAWLPLGLYILRDSEQTGVFIIFISSIWPTLINTAFGVANVDKDYLDVANTLGASRLRTIFKVIIPAALPNIVSGLRISMGIAWLVIVAAEMLLGTGWATSSGTSGTTCRFPIFWWPFSSLAWWGCCWIACLPP